MKPQNFFLSSGLLGSAQAMTLPKGLDQPLTTRSEPSLNWGPCNLELEVPKDLDCATLTVPLDYTGTVTCETIDLQLIRVKATKEPVKGSVLFNPGGPGESGVETVATQGSLLANIIGGQYNLIGFDPRGTGRTIPFNCNLTQGAHARRSEHNLPHSNQWPYIQNQGWKTYEEYTAGCFKAQEKTGAFIGTTSVARDMLSIVDALGEGTQLNYWGVSYGTALGQIFATMFPDRVGRVLLDANVNADSYLTVVDSLSYRDTERAFAHVLDECVIAGPERCPLANYTGPNTTAEDLKLAVYFLFEELINMSELPPDSGLSITDFPYAGHSLLKQLKTLIQKQLYSASGYPNAAALVALALDRNWAALFNSTGGAEESTGTGESKVKWNLGTDALLGISCSDTTFRAESPEEMYSIYQTHLSQGSWGDSNLDALLACAQWKFDSIEILDTGSMRNITTDSPILFVNGIYDPVTPLISAWDASSRFRGSRVLVHEGAGHGITAHITNCTVEAVRGYFESGKMPELETVCVPPTSVWDYVDAESGQ